MAETTCLLNMRAGNRTGGSNPPLSAVTKVTGCSVARLSRLVWDEEVAGSNPATPTKSQLNVDFFFANILAITSEGS